MSKQWVVFEHRWYCPPERVGSYLTEIEAKDNRPKDITFGREECRITYTIERN